MARSYFILIVALFLGAGQFVTLAIFVSEKYPLVANAQSNDSANISVPSNMNRMEITVKNDQSTKPSSLLDSPLLVGVISAGSAIAGGILGSYMTNRSNRQMEDKKYERERKREKEAQAEQEKQKADYADKVKAVVYSELNDTHRFFHLLSEDQDFWQQFRNKPVVHLSRVLRTNIEMTSHEFQKLSFDMKLSVFPPDILYSVQDAYYSTEFMQRTILLLLKRYEKASMAEMETAIKNLALEGTLKDIDNARKELKKILPRSITDKLKDS